MISARRFCTTRLIGRSVAAAQARRVWLCEFFGAVASRLGLVGQPYAGSLSAKIEERSCASARSRTTSTWAAAMK